MCRAKRYLLAVSLLLVLAGCGGGYTWGWYVVWPGTAQGQRNLLFLLSGIGNTIVISVTAILASMTIGLIIAMFGLSKSRCARAVNRGYVEFLRAIPILVLILWVYYGLPVVLNINLGVFAAGAVALALSDSAFEAEIFRSGIQSIERGQHEAADSLGLAYFQKFRFIILPQAIKRILPPLGNQFVYMLKMSSLVSVIGMTELTRRANELVVAEYRPLEIYSFLVLEYLALIMIASYAVRHLERRMGAGNPHAT
ncbi:MAG: amino acid ABC transporter permease [Proteobacteria bacterium]|nr:amino acid ABC transporter permease [Pseudomonadota bacterium]